MAGKEKFQDSFASTTAAQKRLIQLKEWENSETNKQPSTVVSSRRKPTIKFGDDVVFLAAAHSGDIEEVERLVLKEGADVNSINKDGLTALHQCCIDDDFDMVKALVRLGANVDQQDNEGWTPLHAAASCGHAHIVSFLLEQGAFPALVNNEGDTPLTLAEDNDDIVDMLQSKIDKDLIDVNAVRGVEEQIMLEDANRLKNDHTLKPIISHGGATPLHIAAAKNYLQVMKILLSLKASQVQVDAEDDDGWTPLHAAVYWGHFVGAEELVDHGADLNKKTKAGDTIEDLCEPELEDDLNSLKKYGERNNRTRSNAISQTKPRLNHSNSREDLGKHSSPQIVRRRSSKERSMFPKIDIAKEREERENFAADSSGDSSPPLALSGSVVVKDNHNSPPITKSNLKHSVTSNPTPSEAREVAQEKDNSAKDQVGDKHTLIAPSKLTSSTSTSISISTSSTTTSAAGDDGTSSSSSSSTDVTQSSPPQRLKTSPKAGKKKFPSMSPKMMMRVGQWESQSSTPSSSSRGPIPLASSTPSSTSASSTPSSATSNGDNHHRPAAATEPKRYSFQPKTISPSSSSSSLPPRSMSNDFRYTSNLRSNLLSNRKPATVDDSTIASKRSSFDETNNKQYLATPEDEDYKASSLPRGAKITSTGISAAAAASKKKEVVEKPVVEEKKKEVVEKPVEDKLDLSAVSTEAVATPGSHTDGSYLNATRESREFSRERSVESNTSSSSGRGATEESETSRRNRARKLRQQRKSTQPVPQDVLEQITKHDEMEISKSEAPAGSESPGNERQQDKPKQPSAKDGTPATKSSAKDGSSSPPTTTKSETSSSKTKVDDDKPVTMSSYRPSARPTSRILNTLLAQQQSTWPPTTEKIKMADVVEQKMKVELRESLFKSANSKSSTSSTPSPSSSSSHLPSSGPSSTSTSSSYTKQKPSDSSPSASPPTAHRVTTTGRSKDESSNSPPTHPRSKSTDASKDESSSTPPMHPRTKSTARRKPKEKRRSTGIVSEAFDTYDGEEISDELSKLMRKSGDGATSSTPNTDYTPQSGVLDDPTDESSSESKELARLRALLAEEQEKNKQVRKELEETKGKVLELNRRYQDATRAYEQERRENEMKDVRIQELKNNNKTLQDLKHENQRMKDENGALIRVIGKLSRSPLPQTHT